ncbi:UdgX family uracil-DNA binding protein [Novosphingobium rosa]|uniref:UdgX family uracil-DNA binding protein n=1 Tax=Novosphingobium rosa TaxID=76978 RepID=UPI000835896C|nr:UdgX family uracil-DNA binding protein [Novosphingobium rosa]
MHRICLDAFDDVEGWRTHARRLAQAGVPPEAVLWQVGDAPGDLFGGEPQALPPATGRPLTVPKPFITLAEQALLHSDPQRFALLYALLVKIAANPALLGDHADPLLRRVESMASTVRRDIHKMHAFLRFREVQEGGVEEERRPRFIAWYEPEHYILRANASFFVDRFAAMRWSILTPQGTLHWDGETLTEGPPARREEAPKGDPVEAAWQTYYSAIFNPARLMTGAMLKEMPRKYWKNMPETALVPGMIADARRRELAMVAQAPQAPRITRHTLPQDPAAALRLLREEAAGCRRCGLCGPATQTVFGEGPADAGIMVVGEQPGDQEDRAGRPFIGPAGALFDRALAQAGVPRDRLYVTNAVKHFKFEQRGKQRLHARPNVGEIDACRWWLDQERAILRPRLVIAMGKTALRALTGQNLSIGREAGQEIMLADGTPCRLTVHPSHLLRLPSQAEAEQGFERYVADLRGGLAGLEEPLRS